jgi:hypothetical protein
MQDSLMDQDFETVYFDFEMGFQTLLEIAGLFDTWSDDAVSPNFNNELVQVAWKELKQSYGLNQKQMLVGTDQFKKAEVEIENILTDVFDGYPPDVFTDSLGDKRDEVKLLVSEMIENILKGL